MSKQSKLGVPDLSSPLKRSDLIDIAHKTLVLAHTAADLRSLADDAQGPRSGALMTRFVGLVWALHRQLARAETTGFSRTVAALARLETEALWLIWQDFLAGARVPVSLLQLRLEELAKTPDALPDLVPCPSLEYFVEDEGRWGFRVAGQPPLNSKEYQVLSHLHEIEFFFGGYREVYRDLTVGALKILGSLGYDVDEFLETEDSEKPQFPAAPHSDGQVVRGTNGGSYGDTALAEPKAADGPTQLTYPGKNGQNGLPPVNSARKPHWRAEVRVLSFRGSVPVDLRATWVQAVLDRFQDEGWPKTVKIPNYDPVKGDGHWRTYADRIGKVARAAGFTVRYCGDDELEWTDSDPRDRNT